MRPDLADAQLKNRILILLNNLLWAGILTFTVGLALYTSIGRVVMGNVDRYQTELLREINARLDFVVEADAVRGHWESLTPYLELQNVRLGGANSVTPALQVERLNLGFDVLDTILTGTPQLYLLQAQQVELEVELDAEGQLKMAGVALGEGFLLEPVLHFVFNTERLLVDELVLSLRHQEQQYRGHGSMQLLRDQEFRRLNLSLFDPGAAPWLELIGEASGDPANLDRLDARLHLQLRLDAAEGHADFANLAGLRLNRGQFNGEFWLSMTAGRLHGVTDFSTRDIVLARLVDAGDPIELERISGRLSATEVERGWEFAASQLQAGSGAEEFALEGANASFRDDSWQFHFPALDIAPLVDYLQAQKLLPPGGNALLASLSPSGQVTRLQASIADLGQEKASWQVQANFASLAINSWKGVPSMDSAEGYFSLRPGAGLIQIDARDFTLGFPALYGHPLNYQNFAVELAFMLERDQFALWSGRLTGRGEEGEVQGLMALSVPRNVAVVKPELDLLLAIENTAVQYRQKYLPRTLPTGLLQWLERSIGSGHLERVGFAFRGSLRKVDRALRSQQFFIDVVRAELDYHPDWPALSDVAASLYVDNTSVDAEIQRARCLDSVVESAAVSLRPGGGSPAELLLAVDARLEGPAQDGLEAVNQSPLRGLVGDALADWQMRGELSTALELAMDLRAPGPSTRVSLQSEFVDVALDLAPWGVVVQQLQGTLRYHTGSGFSSRNLRASLWGQPLRVEVVQGAGTNGVEDLVVRVNGPVESDALRRWLDLDVLRLASGGTQAELQVVVPAEGQPRIEISSDLHGVALDLPQGFAKAADERNQLRVEISLDGTAPELMLSLDQRIWLQLLFADGGLAAAGLGFAQPQLADSRQRLVIGGELERLEWDPWMDFVGRYVLAGQTGFGVELLLLVRDLKLGELEIGGHTLNDLQFSARQLDAAWHLDFNTGWVRGSAGFPADLSRVSLTLDELDLDGVPEYLFDLVTSETSYVLPELQVTVEDMQRRGQALGNLDFDLRQTGDNYHLSNISGNLRGLSLGGDGDFALDWLREGDGDSTRVHGTVQFQNFGDVLSQYSYQQVLETSGGGFDIDMRWPGAPMDFRMAASTGRIGVAMEQGRFLNSSAAAEGTLRVVGLLNLTEFVRRLSFDTGTLFQSGISFDSISGELLLREGSIEVPQMDVLGRSSRFQFVGLVDLDQVRVDGELLATLPIASNLPWVAAAIGGLPAAAGVYVVSKLFTQQVDRFSSIVYDISGPWEDPEVRFERIFDTDLKQREASSANGESGGAPADEP